tara:strand:- start:288 stop:425 length:138 start_codon:yes stop_codon:yes gene_type:complete
MDNTTKYLNNEQENIYDISSRWRGRKGVKVFKIFNGLNNNNLRSN